ncbi:MAG: glycosyltransferase family 39 protein, partial [Anaerolineae bacterium]|nr:glycosyltransferase family 39 protein [Anaerolineae bacterium]
MWVLAGVMLLAAALRLWQLDVLPPGLFFDEAYNGFDARQVLEGVSRPLFFAANNGREPLFIYLQALSIALLGPTPFALRVVSAMVGILTIPIMYFCAYTVLRTTPSSPQGDRRAGWLALVAAAGLAVSYWHVSLSRVGFRAILLIPVSALAIAFFWRAWTEGRTRDYVLAGIALALALYTYIAARLLPFVVAAFV